MGGHSTVGTGQEGGRVQPAVGGTAQSGFRKVRVKDVCLTRGSPD